MHPAIQSAEADRHASFELYTPLVLEKNAQHPQDLPWETEMRRPSPNHREADTLEGLCQVQNLGQGSLILFFWFAIKSFHFHQYFPHGLLSSSVSTFRGAQFHAPLLLPPPPLLMLSKRWHECNRSLTCNVFRYQEEHSRTSLLQAPPSQQTPDFSSCFFCQLQGNFRWKLSHPIPVFACTIWTPLPK